MNTLKYMLWSPIPYILGSNLMDIGSLRLLYYLFKKSLSSFVIVVAYATNRIQHNYVNSVFIASDLTPAQQKRNKQLWADVVALNKSGNKFQIKNGKIIPREVQSSNQQWMMNQVMIAVNTNSSTLFKQSLHKYFLVFFLGPSTLLSAQ